ncbi:L-histidine N(alpha)-methyltransferase [Chitinophaga costaii]|nr:L-histidine N(alpha)-methyltransferase [Chitinophaga costaii]
MTCFPVTSPLPQSAFCRDVMKGLSAPQKKLDSKYFYDAVGDRLFQDLMNCKDYYPTQCELDILSHQQSQIAQVIQQHLPGAFDLVELGAGDATKSVHLLHQLIDNGNDYTYYPIDISSNVIAQLEQELPLRVPGLHMQGLQGEYFNMLEAASERSNRSKVVLFMGANIGNFTREEARSFCKDLRARLQPGDLVMIGFDLKKHPLIILNAYNDQQGITRAFNLNLLTRINRELGADFNVDAFTHYAYYDPISGACKSFLVSLEAQRVHIGERVFRFKQDECIDMEISLKYNQEEINQLAADSGFMPVQDFYDEKKWFVDCIWKV